MKGSNSLTSHTPESSAFNCLKMYPKQMVKEGYGGKFNKKFHNRKARQTRKFFLRQEYERVDIRY